MMVTVNTREIGWIIPIGSKAQGFKRVGAMTEDGKVKINKLMEATSDFERCRLQIFLYQKKLQPLFKEILETMSQTNQKLLDQQALGVGKLMLVKNTSYNILNEKILQEKLLVYKVEKLRKSSRVSKCSQSFFLQKNVTIQKAYKLRRYSNIQFTSSEIFLQENVEVQKADG